MEGTSEEDRRKGESTEITNMTRKHKGEKEEGYAGRLGHGIVGELEVASIYSNTTV